jgi:RNA polymerase sigma-70 factor, ECF subfamily
MTMSNDGAEPVQSAGEVTELLALAGDGDDKARARLMEVVYGELKRLAAWHLQAERAGHTLQPSALVNEAYLRLAGQFDKDWKNRSHFFAVAAQVMRQVLVDHAKRNKAAKRGGGAAKVELTDGLAISVDALDEILVIDEALTRLALVHERKAKVVELRFLGGLTEDEVARVLAVDPRTVKRDWEFARAWLYGELANAARA